ncbi:hypothetical protein MUB24_08525 [Lederbergia sp. NSJ-179]|uniref:DUF6944 family repetitive protein n=1 Tax=Lederbergia sp. NSJ-179 TaxID=2931402 RepID=UPI001FD4AC88|nr:hypothetical protein [Lederbergia sp. NSJ-179]MCJ7840946.1 hypothetical protein [Lederbergia sp. NSJ-179]
MVVINNESLAIFGSWVQAIGTTLSAIGSTSSLKIKNSFRRDLDLYGNVLQATGNSLVADSARIFTLDKLGNEVQAIGNSTSIVGIVIDFNEASKRKLNIKGDLLQAVGGGISLADGFSSEPSPEQLYTIYGNFLQIIGSSLQAFSGIKEQSGLNGQKINEIGTWIQAIGAIITAIGQSIGAGPQLDKE